jgi:predicted nuclease with TOPRIM domain
MGKKVEEFKLTGAQKKNLIQLKKIKDKIEKLDEEKKALQEPLLKFIHSVGLEKATLYADDVEGKYAASSKKSILKSLLLEHGVSSKTVEDCTKAGKTYEYITFGK